MSIDNAVRSANIGEVKRITSGWTDIDTLMNAGAVKVTLAWMAVHYNSPKVLKYTLSKGANIDFRPNGKHPSVRDYCLLKPDCIIPVIESGHEPTRLELMCYARQNIASDIHSSEEVEFLRSSYFDITARMPEGEAGLITFLSTQPFVIGLVNSYPGVTPESRDALASRIINLKSHVLALSYTTHIAILTNHYHIVREEVASHFSGYRRNRDWIVAKTKRAVSSLCQKLSPLLDLDEDDDILTLSVELTLARFPIRALVQQHLAPERARPSTGLNFENDTLQRLSIAGYSARRVGGTGDQGADVLARKSELTYAVQCKDLSVPVGNAAVQQALAAKSFYHTDFAVVCSSRGFTASAIALAEASGVILVKPETLGDLETLIKNLR